MEKSFTVNFSNWQDLTKETAALFFTESEKRLQETLNSYALHTDKAFRILALQLPSITLVAGFVVFGNSIQGPVFNIPAFLFVLIQSIAIYYLIQVAQAFQIQPLGSMPKNLLVPETISKDNNGLQYIGWVINLCENMQDKIDHNARVNEKRAKCLNRAIWISGICAPILSFIAFLLVQYCSHYHSFWFHPNQ